jgi:hypothetical protein
VGHLLAGHGGPEATGRSLGAYSDEQLALFDRMHQLSQQLASLSHHTPSDA